MRISLSDDQLAVQSLFTDFFAKTCDSAVARRAEPLGFDAELWHKLVSLDALTMGVPAETGGGGASLADLVVLAECAGRFIAPVPVVEHVVALRAMEDPPEDLRNGEHIATIALNPADPDLSWGLVPAGAVAQTIVGLSDDRTVVVNDPAPGCAPSNHACMPLAWRSAANSTARDLGDRALWARAFSEWLTLTAAALVGVAAKSLQLGVEYVSGREQFGQPIGAFQAVQHGLADLPGLIDGARLLSFKAAWAMERPDGQQHSPSDVDDNAVTDPDALALMAFLFATDVAATVTDRVLHYHGGYGFAEEYDIGLYYRRARGWSLILGDPAVQYRRLADRLFGQACELSQPAGR